MKNWSQDCRFQICQDTLMKSFDDKVALAHMQTKRFHLLNPTAALIWNLISAGHSVEELQAQISEQFNVPAEEISTSIHEVIGLLNAEAFIKPKG